MSITSWTRTLLILGSKGREPSVALLTGNVDWTKIPSDTLYKLPMTLGTNWQSSDSSITAINVPNFYNLPDSQV